MQRCPEKVHLTVREVAELSSPFTAVARNPSSTKICGAIRNRYKKRVSTQKLGSTKPQSVTKRMKEKAFAASVNRDIIMECEDIGVPLEEFVQLSLEAMRGIATQLGL